MRIGDSVRTQLRLRKSKALSERRAQIKQGTLCDYRGLIQGTPLTDNGNYAYVLTNGLGVIRAEISNPTGAWQSGTGVRLSYDQELQRYYIVGLDGEAFQAAGATVQTFNPMSPDNLYMDSGFILDFLSQPVITQGTSTLIEIKPGVIDYSDGGVSKRYEYDGTQVDLSSYVATSGNHKILQIWIDPFNDTLQYTQSTEQSTATDFDSTDWDETRTGAGNWLPIQAWRIDDNSDSVITQANKLRDNRPIYTLPYASGISHRRAISTKTSNYTITATDSVILVDASSSAVTITLPDATNFKSYQFDIKAIDITNTVQLATTSSQTIDGSSASITYGSQYENITVISDGSNWSIL